MKTRNVEEYNHAKYVIIYFVNRDLGAQDIFWFGMEDMNPDTRRLIQSNVTGKDINKVLIFF